MESEELSGEELYDLQEWPCHSLVVATETMLFKNCCAVCFVECKPVYQVSGREKQLFLISFAVTFGKLRQVGLTSFPILLALVKD